MISDFGISKSLQKRSHALIPGGSHTYAKGDDQYPEQAPGFIARGKGCHVWDVDGNEFIEYGMGNRAVTLGHAYEPVVRAASEEMLRGVNFARPSPLEADCAERFLELISGAEMVKFAKDGSATTTAALKLARAATGRDYVACCGDHPFFSTNDWFIGTTPMDAGIPRAVKDLTLTFPYDDLTGLMRLFAVHPRKIAAVILEPAKYEDPREGYLREAMRICHENGALFILDEMITGFRWHLGGGQAYYDVVPDLSTFGKALGNGFAISALAGKREFMERGGILHDRERVFLLSTTHGAETHALAAAMATMQIYRDEQVVERLDRQGERLAGGIRETIRRHGLEEFFEVIGKPCCLVFAARDLDGHASQWFRSLFLQEMIKRGVLAPSLVVSFSHADADIDRTVDATDGALEVYARALDDGVERHLVGLPSQGVRRRFNAAPELEIPRARGRTEAA